VVHPGYTDPESLANDVALLIFENPGFNITPTVSPICLWDEDYDFSRISGATGKVPLRFTQAVV